MLRARLINLFLFLVYFGKQQGFMKWAVACLHLAFEVGIRDCTGPDMQPPAPDY